MRFNFPKTKFADENGVYEQLQHVQSEIKEMFEAYFNEPDIDIFAGEAMDASHSIETLLRILEEKRGVNLSKIRCLTERKNMLRHYYDEVPADETNAPS